MRTLFALLAACVFSSVASAQVSPPYLGTVNADRVVLRAGPGEGMDETGQIPRGERLIVVQEVGSQWLAVQPPQGQLSWIKAMFIEEISAEAASTLPRNVRVLTEGEIDIAAGRPGEPKPLNVRKTRIPDGSIVVLIGNKVQVGTEAWVPIAPPPGDVRYVPRSAIDFTRATSTQNYTVSTPSKPVKEVPPITPNPADPNTTGTGTGMPLPDGVSPGRQAPGATVGRTRPNNWPNDPLWFEAEQAEQNGDYERAERLYLQIVYNNNRPNGDQELVNLCFTRVHEVRKKLNARPVSGPSGSDQRTTTPRTGEPSGPDWYGPAELRRTGFRYDDRPTFSFVDKQGKVRAYLHTTDGAGIDMDANIGKEAEVYGSVSYPKELRGLPLLMISRIRPPTRRGG